MGKMNVGSLGAGNSKEEEVVVYPGPESSQ